jgi:hypothetical protein
MDENAYDEQAKAAMIALKAIAARADLFGLRDLLSILSKRGRTSVALARRP